MEKLKIENFTEGQIELLRALVKEKCNIALYRSGECRLRDSNHNPLKNLRSDMFEKIRKFLVRREGLFFINEEIINSLPNQITR